MSTLRNPVGPLPPSVYWRRRILLLIGVAAVIVIIVLIIVRPGGAEQGAQSPPPTNPASTPAADPTQLCDPSVISLTPVIDATSYGKTTNPLLSMSITNSSAVACTFDVGTDAQEYIITSGSDRIWDSTDCQTGGAPQLMVLEPGVLHPTAPPIEWQRVRSAKGSCGSDRPKVTAGGASYHLSVALGAAKSQGSGPQFVLK